MLARQHRLGAAVCRGVFSGQAGCRAWPVQSGFRNAKPCCCYGLERRCYCLVLSCNGRAHASKDPFERLFRLHICDYLAQIDEASAEPEKWHKVPWKKSNSTIDINSLILECQAQGISKPHKLCCKLNDFLSLSLSIHI